MTDLAREQLAVVCYLVGAGPGDPGLLTVKATRLLKTADAVVYDHLIPQGVLHLAPSHAEKIYVGKRGGEKSISQKQLNERLYQVCLDLHKRNQTSKSKKKAVLVRLKGGDPTIFARAAEEMEMLLQKGIDFYVVPGVSSFHAAPAYAGIPLTARGASSSVSIMTGRFPKSEKKISVIEASDTVVYLMSMKNLTRIVEKNLSCGKPPNTPLAIIEQGTTPKQRTTISTLGKVLQETSSMSLKHPGLVVIGPVAAMAKHYSWYQKQPLFAKRVGLYRDGLQMTKWSESFLDCGVLGHFLPLIESSLCKERESGMVKALEALQKKTPCIIFTSKRAVDFFWDVLKKIKKDARFLSGFSLLSLGDSVSKALADKGLIVDYQAKHPSWGGVFEMMKKIAKKNKKTHFFSPKSLQAENQYLAEIKKAGISFEEVAFYQTKPIFWNAESWKLFEQLNAMVLGSPSTIHSLHENLQRRQRQNDEIFRHPVYILLGKTSEKRFLDFKGHWMQKSKGEILHLVADYPSVQGVIECLERYFKR